MACSVQRGSPRCIDWATCPGPGIFKELLLFQFRALLLVLLCTSFLLPPPGEGLSPFSQAPSMLAKRKLRRWLWLAFIKLSNVYSCFQCWLWFVFRAAVGLRVSPASNKERICYRYCSIQFAKKNESKVLNSRHHNEPLTLVALLLPAPSVRQLVDVRGPTTVLGNPEDQIAGSRHCRNISWN